MRRGGAWGALAGLQACRDEAGVVRVGSRPADEENDVDHRRMLARGSDGGGVGRGRLGSRGRR